MADVHDRKPPLVFLINAIQETLFHTQIVHLNKEDAENPHSEILNVTPVIKDSN